MEKYPFQQYLDQLIEADQFAFWARVLLEEMSLSLEPGNGEVYAIGHDDNDGIASQQLILTLGPEKIQVVASTFRGLRYRNAFGSMWYMWMHKALILLIFAINQAEEPAEAVDASLVSRWQSDIRKKVKKLGLKKYLNQLLLTPCPWPILIEDDQGAMLDLQAAQPDEFAGLNITALPNMDIAVSAFGRIGESIRDGVGGQLDYNTSPLIRGALAVLIQAIIINARGNYQVIPPTDQDD